jgi:hypothetical protein
LPFSVLLFVNTNVSSDAAQCEVLMFQQIRFLQMGFALLQLPSLSAQ